MREVIKNLLTSTSSRNGPQQIAAAIAVGLLCGLVPASSGMFYVLLAGAYFLPIHLPLTLLTALGIGMLSPGLQSTLGEVGSRSLQHPQLSEIWLELEHYPLIPWLGLHNSIVNGGMLCGIALLLPVYLTARPLAMRICDAPAVEESIALADAPVRVPRTVPVSRDGSDEAEPSSLDFALASAIATADEGIESVLVDDLEELLAECISPNTSNRLPSNTQAVIERASRVAELVDDILANLEDDDAQLNPSDSSANLADNTSQSRFLNQESDAAPIVSESTDAPECCVAPAGNLYSSSGPQLSATSQTPEPSPDAVEPTPTKTLNVAPEEASVASSVLDTRPVRTQAFESGGTRIQVVRGSAELPASIQGCEMQVQSLCDLEMSENEIHMAAKHAEKKVTVHSTHTGSEAPHGGGTGHVAQREEALRYLLSHLRELKEKV